MAAFAFDQETKQLLGTFAFYATLVLAKTLAMSFITALKRIPAGIFANPEDCRGQKDSKGENVKPRFGVDSVERVRRAHLNDLENILPFVFIGMIYCWTNPPLAKAILHFRIFTASRFIHTLVYLGQIRQPARVLAFVVSIFAQLSMVYQILCVTGFKF